MNEKRVVIVGGSGFIGSNITEALLGRGYRVISIDLHAPRDLKNGMTFIKADLSKENVDLDIFNGCYGVINLAGATIGKRWNADYKKSMYESRIKTTKRIVEIVKSVQEKPTVFVSASAVGYYGDKKDTVLSEEAAPGTDFLAKLCVDWEHAALQAEGVGIRTVLIRTAHVLGKGGLLASLSPLFKIGLGGYFGSGEQSMPWVHWKDIVGIYMYALENQSVRGPYNVGAGKTISQKDLFKAYGKAIRAPFVWHIPTIAAKIIVGEFADSLMASQNTTSEKIIQYGYVYSFNDINLALENLVFSKSP